MSTAVGILITVWNDVCLMLNVLYTKVMSRGL